MSDSPNFSEGIVPPLLGDYFTLAEASKTLPRVNGRKIHTSTLWRWCRRGCKGIKLRYYRVGRTIMVSEAALNQFFTALAQADAEQTDTHDYKPRPKRRRPGNRQASIDRANDVLRKAGILV